MFTMRPLPVNDFSIVSVQINVRNMKDREKINFGTLDLGDLSIRKDGRELDIGICNSCWNRDDYNESSPYTMIEGTFEFNEDEEEVKAATLTAADLLNPESCEFYIGGDLDLTGIRIELLCETPTGTKMTVPVTLM